VREPDNHTALVDRFGGTWVRVDECPGQFGKWWPITDGPGWEPQVQDGVGQARPWDQVVGEYGPFDVADPDRAVQALERVRREVAR
jgi:hypothetical protein